MYQGLCTDGAINAIALIQKASKRQLAKWAKWAEMPGWSKMGKQQLVDALITGCIDQCVINEGYDPREMNEAVWWFEADYAGAAQMSGIQSHERLNTISLNDFMRMDKEEDEYLEPERDEAGPYDEMDGEENFYRSPVDPDILIDLIRLQIKMEEVMINIKSYDSRALELRDTYRRVTDRHMKKLPWDGKWYKVKGLLQKWNTWCREVCKGLKDQPEDKALAPLWEEWNRLKDECDELVGFDKRYRGILSGIAPYIPGRRTVPDGHVMLWGGKIVPMSELKGDRYMRYIPPAQSVGTIRELRVQRIKWLKEALAEKELERELELENEGNVNWVMHDDDKGRQVDSFEELSKSLNRGEDMRDNHVDDPTWQEVYVPMDLWSNRKRWKESYFDWNENQILTEQYKKLWEDVQKQRNAATR